MTEKEYIEKRKEFDEHVEAMISPVEDKDGVERDKQKLRNLFREFCIVKKEHVWQLEDLQEEVCTVFSDFRILLRHEKLVFHVSQHDI